MTEYITFTSAAAALVTALATLIVVIEMRRQRLSAFQPEFAIMQSKLHVWRDKHNYFQITINDNVPELFHLDLERPTVLMIVNVGLGAAKAIQVQWDYDILNFIRVVKAFDNEDEFNIVSEDDRLHISSTKINELSCTCSYGKHFIESLPYILPAAVESTPRALTLPYSYLSLLKIWTYLSLSNLVSNDSPWPSLQSLPDLTAILSYKDIANTVRNRSFRIKFGTSKLVGAQPMENDSFLECMVATLEVSEL